MQHATRSTKHAARNTQHETCSTQHAARNTAPMLHSTPHATARRSSMCRSRSALSVPCMPRLRQRLVSTQRTLAGQPDLPLQGLRLRGHTRPGPLRRPRARHRRASPRQRDGRISQGARAPTPCLASTLRPQTVRARPRTAVLAVGKPDVPMGCWSAPTCARCVRRGSRSDGLCAARTLACRMSYVA